MTTKPRQSETRIEVVPETAESRAQDAQLQAAIAQDRARRTAERIRRGKR